MAMAPGDTKSARPASLGANVLVNDAHDTERPGTIIDSVSGEYLVRFDDKSERWLRLDCLKTLDGRPMSTPRRATSSNVRRAATVNLATPTPRNYSQEVEVGDLRDLRPAEEVLAPDHKETEPALFLDKRPPARHSTPGPERQRTSGRYSYTGDSNRPPPSDRVSARAVETARKSVTSPVPPVRPRDWVPEPTPSSPRPNAGSSPPSERAPSERAPHYDGARSNHGLDAMNQDEEKAHQQSPAPRSPEHPSDELSDYVKNPPKAAWILVAVACAAVTAFILLWFIDF